MPPFMSLISLAKNLPNVYKYGAAVLLALSLVSGIYYKGYSSGKSKGEQIVADYVTKYKTQELAIQRSQNVIAQLSMENLLKKVDTIHLRGAKNATIASNVPASVIVNDVGSEFTQDTTHRVHVELPLGWVYTHDASASNHDADSALSSNGTASGFTPNDALRTVVTNYSACYENAARLTALQDWIRQSTKAIDSISKGRP